MTSWNYAVCVCLLLAGIAQAQINSPFEMGEFRVGHRQIELEIRTRSYVTDVWHPIDGDSDVGEQAQYQPILDVDFRFPSDIALDAADFASGEHPLLVYHHGDGLTASSQSMTHEKLASHGFIVVGPNDYRGTSSVIDAVLGMSSDPNSPFFEKVDSERVGVFGASGGGEPTLRAGSRDERVKAIMPITSIGGTSLISIPTMLLTGSDDALRGISTTIFHNLDAPRSYLAEIEGAHHTSFGVVCDRLEYALANNAPESVVDLYSNLAVGTCEEDAITNLQAVQITSSLSTAFFGTFVAGESTYADFLDEDVFTSRSLPVSLERAAVPEPSGLTLMLFGALVVLLLREVR